MDGTVVFFRGNMPRMLKNSGYMRKVPAVEKGLVSELVMTMPLLEIGTILNLMYMDLHVWILLTPVD